VGSALKNVGWYPEAENQRQGLGDEEQPKEEILRRILLHPILLRDISGYGLS